MEGKGLELDPRFPSPRRSSYRYRHGFLSLHTGRVLPSDILSLPSLPMAAFLYNFLLRSPFSEMMDERVSGVLAAVGS